MKIIRTSTIVALFIISLNLILAVPGLDVITHIKTKACVGDTSEATWKKTVTDTTSNWTAKSGIIEINNSITGDSTGNSSLTISASEASAGKKEIKWPSPGVFSIKITVNYERTNKKNVIIKGESFKSFTFTVTGPGPNTIESPGGTGTFVPSPPTNTTTDYTGLKLDDINLPTHAGSYLPNIKYTYTTKLKNTVETILTCNGPCEKMVKLTFYVDTVNVTLSSEINMPVWTDYKNGSCKAKVEWDRFIKMLTSHETEHFTKAKEYGQKLANQQINLSATVTECKQETAIKLAGTNIDTALKNKLAEIHVELKTSQDDFDVATDNGATTGALLDANKEGECEVKK